MKEIEIALIRFRIFFSGFLFFVWTNYKADIIVLFGMFFASGQSQSMFRSEWLM